MRNNARLATAVIVASLVLAASSVNQLLGVVNGAKPRTVLYDGNGNTG